MKKQKSLKEDKFNQAIKNIKAIKTLKYNNGKKGKLSINTKQQNEIITHEFNRTSFAEESKGKFKDKRVFEIQKMNHKPSVIYQILQKSCIITTEARIRDLRAKLLETKQEIHWMELATEHTKVGSKKLSPYKDEIRIIKKNKINLPTEVVDRQLISTIVEMQLKKS